MKLRNLSALAVALAGAATLSAQELKVTSLIEVWYTQMLENTLRNDAAFKPASGAAYYDGMSSGRFAENGFTVKRAEIYLSGKISDNLSVNIMFDPNNAANTVGNNVLQDGQIIWKVVPSFTILAGQFKMPTTYEATIVAARNIIFFDRNQLNRVFGDKRDRGVVGVYSFGDPKGFNTKVNFGISNGSTDDGSSGKTAVDANAQKDFFGRLQMAYGSEHQFGAYYREGGTAVKTSTYAPSTFTITTTAWGTTGIPSVQDIKDNADRTTLLGAYYAYDSSTWHFDAEAATGELGRRFATIPTASAGAVGREHLHQKYLGYAITGVYKMGAHWIAARYDMLNYNSGNDWYAGGVNPYMPTTGANAGGDFSPKYTETTVGYNYLFVPSKYSYGKLKIDFIMRSKNFLSSSAALGQTGAQGGNSLVASLMFGF